MAFRNDPDLGAIPNVKDGTVDIAYRTKCGEAARFDGDVDALIAFLGDEQLVNFAGQLYRKSADGTLSPLTIEVGKVCVNPPAGEWFTLTESELKTEYAIVVHVLPKKAVVTSTTSATPGAPGERGDLMYQLARKKPTAKKAPVKKAAPATK